MCFKSTLNCSRTLKFFNHLQENDCFCQEKYEKIQDDTLSRKIQEKHKKLKFTAQKLKLCAKPFKYVKISRF